MPADFHHTDADTQPDTETLSATRTHAGRIAIKWYKDNEEFYRYVPKARPPKTSYRVDGVRVIVSTPDVLQILVLSVRLGKKQYIT